MPLNIQIPKIYDHTDGDLIVINKSNLVNILGKIKDFAFSSGTCLGWFGIFVALGSAAFLTETFKSVGRISGDTIRALFLMLAILTLGFFVKTGLIWVKSIKKNNPDTLVSDLLKAEPIILKDIQTNGPPKLKKPQE